jgi:hypothetical protein
MTLMALGFEYWVYVRGSGFRISGLGFRVQDMKKFSIWGLWLIV